MNVYRLEIIIRECNTKYDTIISEILSIYEKFVDGKVKSQEWTVLAAIFIVGKESHRIISVASGSKCINSDRDNKDGKLLFDSHAEILCKRGFQLYLLEEMKNISESEYFEKLETKIKLKPDKEIVMYISEIPCGDASIFPTTEAIVIKKGIKRMKCSPSKIF